MFAVVGKAMSPVVVPSTMRSISPGSTWARSGLLRGPDGQIGRRLALVDDVPLSDAGALDDPRPGLDHPLELPLVRMRFRAYAPMPIPGGSFAATLASLGQLSLGFEGQS
jgi:hypothetical protein